MMKTILLMATAMMALSSTAKADVTCLQLKPGWIVCSDNNARDWTGTKEGDLVMKCEDAAQAKYGGRWYENPTAIKECNRCERRGSKKK